MGLTAFFFYLFAVLCVGSGAMVVLATQSEGTVLFFEKQFESRLYFVDPLVQMGANIIVCDPHRAIVSGRTPLVGQTVRSPDIRAGMAMVSGPGQ